MFEKIAFVHYPVRDLERAFKFYREVLGFKLLIQHEEWVEFELGGQRLALRLIDPIASKPGDMHPHGAMVWLEARPIEKMVKNLKNNKVIFINEIQHLSYGKTAVFKDPDDNPIGLYEPPLKE